MKNISNKRGREIRNTHFVFSDFYFEYRAPFEIIWKNIVLLNSPQMIIWRMRIACWIPTATHVHCLSYSNYNNGCWKFKERIWTQKKKHALFLNGRAEAGGISRRVLIVHSRGRSRAIPSSRLISGIAGSNPARALLFVCFVCVCVCVCDLCRYRHLRDDDRSFRGVLSGVFV